MNRRQLFVLVFVAVGWISEPTRADIVINPLTDRSVAVAATDAPPAGVATDADSLPDNGAGTIDAAVATAGPWGVLTANADQTSSTPATTGPLMTGIGTGSLTASPPASSGFSETARSFFDVFFTVDLTQTYQLDATVNWADTYPPGMISGIAIVDLRDVTGGVPGVPLGGISSDPGDPGLKSLLTTALLSVGQVYRLEAKVFMSAGGLAMAPYTASSSFAATLSLVPEVGSAAMMTLATLGAAICAWRRQR
jgi:hypothetical protein